jgi:ubiquinone/menaquinone biosynthesis C-methylase UbiE
LHASWPIPEPWLIVTSSSRRTVAIVRLASSDGDPYHWDDRVDAWEEVAATPSFRALQQLILDAADPGPDDVVVDLGAGTGLLTLALAPVVREVIAIDISPAMLHRLEEHASELGITNITTMEADLRVLPLDDQSVTLAVSNYTFHHLADHEKELALAEVRRVLAPRGRLVICDMMFSLSLEPRDRRVILDKLVAVGRRGPAGWFRIAKNAGRVVAGRWEQPATEDVWRDMLIQRRFTDVEVELLQQEAGIARGRRPGAPHSRLIRQP